MRAERRRTKKLIVAFHFLRSDQSRWKCEECRKQGLDARRRCGFLPEDRRGPRKLVWIRNKTGTEECPKSLMTPASAELVERFWVWKACGSGGWTELTACEADAFQALEEECRAEIANGEQHSRHSER